MCIPFLIVNLEVEVVVVDMKTIYRKKVEEVGDNTPAPQKQVELYSLLVLMVLQVGVVVQSYP